MIIKKLGAVQRDGAESVLLMLANYNTDPRRVAIALQSPEGESLGTLSTNLELPRKPGEFVVAKHNHLEKDLAAYLALGLFEDTGERCDFGHVQNAPVWRLARPEDLRDFEAATAGGESAEPTAWAVKCPTHGNVFLTKREYLTQMMRPDARWECPRCGLTAWFDDAAYEAWCDAHRPKENE